MDAEAARASFEAAINYHEREIVKIKRQLNKLSPIYRLPPEILGTIFICVARSVFDLTRPYGWIRLTHACYEWREVALHTPRLWSHIYLVRNLEFMREVFARSKEAPLHVDILSYETPEVVELAFAHIHHTAVLQLRRGFEKAIGNIPFPPFAPVLGRLELSTEDPESPIANMVLNCRMPELFHLDVHSAAFLFPWSRPIFQNSLTHLTFSNTDRRMSAALHEVLKVLSGMPTLKLVDFDDVLAPPLPSSLSACNTIHLPQLEVLRLRGLCSGCTPFLQHIAYPCTTRLCITVTRASHDLFVVLCREIASKLRSCDLTLRSLVIMPSSDNHRVIAWTEQISAISLKTRAAESGENGSILRIARASEWARSFEPLTPILKILSLSTIHTLSVEQDTLDSNREELFGAMPNIEELSIICEYSYQIPRQIPALLAISTATTPLLRLRILVLVCIALYRSSEDVQNNELVEDFCEMFKSRKDAGHMIEELVLEHATNVDQSGVDAISRTVGKVVWDSDCVEWTSSYRWNAREFYDEDDEDYYGNGFESDEDSEMNWRPYSYD